MNAYVTVAMADNHDDARGLVQRYTHQLGYAAKCRRSGSSWRVYVELPADEAMRDLALAYIQGFCDGRADTMQATRGVAP